MPTKKPAAKKPAANKPSPTKPAAGGVVTFSDVQPLFGLPQDDPKVVAVLTRAGTKFKKPDGGASYAVAKKAGFDLLACRPDDAKRGSPLLVHTAFLYRGGRGRSEFPTPPFGLAFSTRAELLASMPAPEHTWLIGKGIVPVTSAKASHDRWRFDGLLVSADYDEDLTVRSIDVSVDISVDDD